MIPKIMVRDNVLSEYGGIDWWIQEEAVFREEFHGGEGFTIARIPLDINELMIEDMKKSLGDNVEPTYSFMRLSTDTIDSDMRIHSDSGMDAEFASVLYFNDPPEKGNYGTAFWDHKFHGKEFANNDIREANRLLHEDSGDLTQWSMNDLVEMKKNRMVSYPTKFFHSRYPFEGWGKDKTDGRVIWVTFFNYA